MSRIDEIQARHKRLIVAGVDPRKWHQSETDRAYLLERIAELEAKIESLRTCKTCGQDKVIAEIGERFGYRADIMALRVREAESSLERVRNGPTVEMLVAARDWSYKKYGKPIGNEDAIGCWNAMLAAALK